MVKIIDALKRENKEGNPFFVLVLQGDLEFIQSQQNGRFYATAKRCTMTSTFDEQIAKSLIGTEMKGTVARVECEPYPYLLKQTGEQILLSHTYCYVPEEVGEPIGGNKQLQAAAI